MMHAKGDACGDLWWDIVDYDTGLGLNTKKNKGVTKKENTKSSGYWIVYGKDGSWVSGYKQYKTKVTITYPEDYKGLCFGVGGSLANKKTKADKNYDKGKTPFGKAPNYYSEKTPNFHFIRLTK